MTKLRYAFATPSGFAAHYLYHLLVIFPFALLAGWVCGSIPLTLLSALSIGVLIDADHLIDYALEVPASEWNVKGALGGDHFPAARHVYVLLHGYDLALLLGLLVAWLWSVPVAVGLAVGMIVHIATDQLDYNGHPLRYFLLFRLLHFFPNTIWVHAQG